MKEIADKFMKQQLLKMSGAEADRKLELRKFPLTETVDSPNFESVTFEQLEALHGDKPVRLQKYNYSASSAFGRMELFFSDGLVSPAFECTYFSSNWAKHEKTWPTSKPVKKISLKMHKDNYVLGMKFLDENDNELDKWESSGAANWLPAKEIPAGFEVIGIYGDTKKNYDKIQFGLLIWNPKWASQN